jgi:ER membrane protein complex subunit 1
MNIFFASDGRQVRLYPETPSSQAESFATFIRLALHVGAPGRRQILGHQVGLNHELSQFYVAYPTWTMSLPQQEEIHAIVLNTRGPIASIGNVIGNRATLYNYLNLHLTMVLTSSPQSRTCGIYVLDMVKGSIIYHVGVPAAGGVCDVQATLTENWLVYQYFDSELPGVKDIESFPLSFMRVMEVCDFLKCKFQDRD